MIKIKNIESLILFIVVSLIIIMEIASSFPFFSNIKLLHGFKLPINIDFFFIFFITRKFIRKLRVGTTNNTKSVRAQTQKVIV